MVAEALDTAAAEGLVALVTGAASGIGRCVCLELGRRGASGVVMIDRDEVGLEGVHHALAEAGTRSTFHAIDVTDDVALTEAFDAAAKAHGGLDLVHNNAGIMTGLPLYPEIDMDQVDRVIAINLRAVILGIKLGHRALAAAGGGSILSTASGAGKTPFPPDPVYGATKAGVVSLTRSCAPAFAKQGIRINALCPSVVDTPLLAQNANGALPKQITDGSVPLLDPLVVAQAAVELMLDPTKNGETPSIMLER